jgi:argininosuccinate lyase
MMALWGGRFTERSADAMSALSRSVHFDWRLAPYEIEVNLVHLENLIQLNIVSKEDGDTLRKALLELAQDIGSGKFIYINEDEDVHSAIERGLIAKAGPIGGSIRAGRSRNDLVVTDFKLYLIDHLLEIGSAVAELITELNRQAEGNLGVIAPGFTHTQHAQPITFAQELSKHSHALIRDLDRILDWHQRNNLSPFGAGALSGSSIQPNPKQSAGKLGFSDVLTNSIDAVSDRDFVAEALFIMAMVGVHLSRIGEEFVLWSSSEFDFVEISDQYSTGSSIMPQKKNADVAELARGKSGRFIGNLTSLLVVLKALPFAYNRDLQEDKEPVFDSVEQLLMLLPALTGMVSTAKFKEAKISQNASDGYSLATEIADYLAKSGLPFAQAHEAAGACVKYCEKNQIELHQIPTEALVKIHPNLKSDVLQLLTVQSAVETRSSEMGTAPKSVRSAIAALNKDLAGMLQEISRIRDGYSGMISQ